MPLGRGPSDGNGGRRECSAYTAIAHAGNPTAMGGAFKAGVAAGRAAFLAGLAENRPSQGYGASSPAEGLPAAAGVSG